MAPFPNYRSSAKPDKRQVFTVCQRLAAEYPPTRLGNKATPLDEYLYILLSLRTHEPGLLASYYNFKRSFPSWASAASASRRELERVITAGGLARQKADRLKKALRYIQAQFGEVSLRKLRKMTQNEVERFLLQLPGVGIKSAKCIMMYSLGFDVLPVDVHVARISKRLGWVGVENTFRLHKLLENLIPPGKRFTFHVNCVQHGRIICRGQNPKCNVCCLCGQCQKIGIGKS